jgi:hypothetical protein
MYGDTVSIFKVFNAKSHFTSKHEGQCMSLHSDATRKAKELVLNLKRAAKYFTSKTSGKKQVL